MKEKKENSTELMKRKLSNEQLTDATGGGGIGDMVFYVAICKDCNWRSAPCALDKIDKHTAGHTRLTYHSRFTIEQV